jgi:general nucleoside transport system permease protein
VSILTGLAYETVRLSMPYVFCALGGALSEESGVPHIGLEGVMLTSAFAATSVHIATDNPLAGALAGFLCGALVGAIHAGATVLGGVQAIVSGVAINIAAVGVTRAFLRGLYGSSANSPSIRAFAASGGLGFVDPLLFLMIVLAAGSFLLRRLTRFGLSVRAVGENAEAALLVGLDVKRVRVAAVTLGSAVAGLGGVALCYDQHQFSSQMTAGRGFIALAAITLGRADPRRIVPFCLLFAAVEAGQTLLQATFRMPSDLATALPYFVTLTVLMFAQKSPIRRARRAPLAKSPTAG